MGTRNLTIVIHKGKVRMAQYGQWDGYPDGVGRDIANVISKVKIHTLRKAAEKCYFLKSATIEERWKSLGAEGELVSMEVTDAFKRQWPELSRDTNGGVAISLALKAKKKLGLCNQMVFAADSLFCEWAYVVDLDNQVVEVYKGFNEKPLLKNARFYSLQKKMKKDDKYYPIKLFKTYKIKNFTKAAMERLVNSDE